MERKKNRKTSVVVEKENKKRKPKKAVKDTKKESKSKNVKNRKKYKVTKKFYISLIIIVLIIALICLAVFLLTDSKFKVASLKVIGSQTYEASELNEKVVKIYNENIFTVTKKSVMSNFTDYPYIYDVNLSRNLPNTLEINVMERQKCFIAFNKDTSEYIRLDKYGIILERIELNDKQEDEIVLFGINFDDEYKIGSYVEDIELGKLNTYNAVSKKFLENNIEKKITSAEFTEDKIILTLDYTISIIIKNDENLDYNINFLKSILKELEGKSGSIDMTTANPTFSEVK